MHLKLVVNFEPVSVRYLLGASEESVKNSPDSNENSSRHVDINSSGFLCLKEAD